MATEAETQQAKQIYLDWLARAEKAGTDDNWSWGQCELARQRWIACAPTEPTPWWPGGWRAYKPATDMFLPFGGVVDIGVWRNQADAARFLEDPFSDPAVTSRDEFQQRVAREGGLFDGWETTWAAVAEAARPVALDAGFWADRDSGQPFRPI